MEPFSISNSLRNFTDPYPDPELVLDVAGQDGNQARIALTRLWLSEGIPYAFRECPAVYESVRSWLSIHLDVHAKEIGVVGSARIGASFSPNKLGKKFSTTSDLDLFIVSKGLFEKLKGEFFEWSQAFEKGEIVAKNPTEQSYWKDNNKRVPKNIAAGFIDSKYIPNHKPYPITTNIEQTRFLLIEKLKCTPNGPKPREAFVRCYKSWDSFVRQNSLNLRDCSEKVRNER